MLCWTKWRKRRMFADYLRLNFRAKTTAFDWRKCLVQSRRYASTQAKKCKQTIYREENFYENFKNSVKSAKSWAQVATCERICLPKLPWTPCQLRIASPTGWSNKNRPVSFFWRVQLVVKWKTTVLCCAAFPRCSTKIIMSIATAPIESIGANLREESIGMEADLLINSPHSPKGKRNKKLCSLFCTKKVTKGPT